MLVITALIFIPVVAALLLLVIRSNSARAALVLTTVAILIALSVLLVVKYLFVPSTFTIVNPEIINYVAMGISLLCCCYIIYRSVKARNILAFVLAAIQFAMILIYDMGMAHHAQVANDLYVDPLSLIMALIIAIIGGGICIYALGYMKEYQEHLDHDKQEIIKSAGDASPTKDALMLVQDRRHIFFAFVFVFLGAMFTIVFSNRLAWLLTGWEITTVCSFALIGFSRTKEATKNSFRAVVINLAGGIAFTLALIIIATDSYHIFELDQLILAGTGGALVLPIMLIAFAGMTKAAQMPFQSWLLGAMVAPTPVSALLHSSTMVKAGVFIIIKLAPTLGWSIPGIFVCIVGGFTFLCCMALAVSQSNAKRVLAYSTVANLGLIACCAGIGTPEATWAAIFLLIFHAAAKALLFCCVGTAEHRFGSRDIECMDNIFIRMPWLASYMALGMMAMFVAPFGMLVSKWAALVSIAGSGHYELLFILAFGSAITFIAWAKWLGKVLAIGPQSEKKLPKITKEEGATLAGLAILLICVTLGLPLLSDFFVMPYLQGTGLLLELSSWESASSALSYDNLLIMCIILLALLALLVVQAVRKHPKPSDTVYMAGVATDAESRNYLNSFGQTESASQRNWYLERLFGEQVLGRPATMLLAGAMAIFFVLGIFVELVL